MASPDPALAASAPAAPARRNRAETEARLRQAVADLLVEGGFGALTPSAVGKRAGVDKMLIYRYFGDLPGLLRDLVFAPGFFPSFECLCGGRSIADLRALPVAQRAAWIMGQNLRALLARPLVLELMVWEMVERNELTAITEEARETLGARLMTELFADVPDARRLALYSAVISAGVTYLALRRRKIRWYAGIDLTAPDTPEAIEAVIADMCAGLTTA